MSKRLPYSISKLLGVYISWWIVWTIIQTFVLHRLGITWQIAITDSFISNLLLAIAGFIAMVIYRFYQPSKNNRIYRFVFGILITILFCIALQWLLSYIYVGNTMYLEFLDKSIPVRFIFSLLIISFITIINWLWNNLTEQKEVEKRKSDSEQLMKEAELTRLRQQLQPHFLFNSLNSISALVITQPIEARKMVQHLSDFLRGTLKKDDQLVRLEEELEHLKLYLDIEKVRFGHRLSIQFDITENSKEYKIPPLLLQPIIENAIKFGLYDTTGDITINISVYIKNNFLCLEIKNPFDVENKNIRNGEGFGLNSIQRRLYLLYARNDLLTTEKQANIFITTLKIPATT